MFVKIIISREMLLNLLSFARRFLPTTPFRKNGHKRPRKRMLGNPVVLPNQRPRADDFKLELTKYGTYSLVPPSLPNPSLIKDVRLHGGVIRNFQHAIKPNGGRSIRANDVSIDKFKINK